jgi:RimJ/RimL family protein N-acetyltransferase
MGTIPRIISAMGKIVPPASYLRSNLAVLRPLELTDLDLLYQWENDTSDWAASGTNIPFSRTFLIEYILSAQADIYQAGQMRLAIECPATGKLAGAIDLFDFDAKNRRAAIGIIIDSGHRRLGIASRRHRSFKNIFLRDTPAKAAILHYRPKKHSKHQTFCQGRLPAVRA